MNTEIQNLIRIYDQDVLGLLKELDGFYECQKDANGNRVTPLVGYAGKYPANDGKELQYVGEIYANFSKAEEHPSIMYHFTKLLWKKILIKFNDFKNHGLDTQGLVFVGPQMGGVSVAQMMALHAHDFDARYACAEKKITAVATKELREQSELFFGRHEIKNGDCVIICEDVLNNFSTTEEVMTLVKESGGYVLCIVGLLNRSIKFSNFYSKKPFQSSIVSLIDKPFDQYKQDDPYVAEDIANGNVVLKPKAEWHKLQTPKNMVSTQPAEQIPTFPPASPEDDMGYGPVHSPS